MPRFPKVLVRLVSLYFALLVAVGSWSGVSKIPKLIEPSDLSREEARPDPLKDGAIFKGTPLVLEACAGFALLVNPMDN